MRKLLQDGKRSRSPKQADVSDFGVLFHFTNSAGMNNYQNNTAFARNNPLDIQP
jgi:hypothetical protein